MYLLRLLYNFLSPPAKLEILQGIIWFPEISCLKHLNVDWMNEWMNEPGGLKLYTK